jgi:hypothetical protein
MPSKRAQKALSKTTPNASLDDEPAPSTLLSPSPPDCLPSIESPLATTPTVDKPTQQETGPSTQQEKGPSLRWTAEMIEALVECIYSVWKDGRSADNGYKKEAWIEASNAVSQVYRGASSTIEWEKCKNKWTDLKEKWKHWVILSEQSGFGWDNIKERYEADDYVWENLNKFYPRIIWHKTYIMPH